MVTTTSKWQFVEDTVLGGCRSVDPDSRSGATFKVVTPQSGNLSQQVRTPAPTRTAPLASS